MEREHRVDQEEQQDQRHRDRGEDHAQVGGPGPEPAEPAPAVDRGEAPLRLDHQRGTEQGEGAVRTEVTGAVERVEDDGIGQHRGRRDLVAEVRVHLAPLHHAGLGL
jgi:hypothetical protein